YIYNLKIGQWILGFQAAADTVDDFAFQPSQPITVSSSGHRRFQVPADEDNSYQRTGTSSYAYHLQNFFKLWLSSCGTSHLLNYDYLKLCFTPTNDANNQVMVAHWTNKAVQKGVEELELNFDRGLDPLSLKNHARFQTGKLYFPRFHCLKDRA
ncbi:hypothetical protein LINGRAHAP2_LOCUS24543, partial [Linum grandiflorum]